MSAPLTTRFAPSPSGAMHLGNLRTALFNWLLARSRGGRFLLRVEDTDHSRSDEQHVALLLEDLAWLGLDWDAGPDCEDGNGPYRQSLRAGIYATRLEQLAEAGLAYPCYCSQAELEVARRRQAAAGEPPRYPGTCRDLSQSEREDRIAAGRSASLRFRVPDTGSLSFEDRVRGPQQADRALLGDFLLCRPDGSAMFFFVNAVDDALMGVTDVLRGEDHLSNTFRQLLVLDALGLPPPRYGHLPMLLGEDNTPLSKRAGSTGAVTLRTRGYLPAAVANYLLRLGHAGAPDDWVEPAALPAAFDPARLGRAPAHFDPAQLDHWQREAVKRLPPEAAQAWLGDALAEAAPPRRAGLAELLRHNVLLPEDARPWVAILGDAPPPPGPEARAALAEAGPEFFAAAVAALDRHGPDLPALAREVRAATGRKGAALFMPLRLALTGRGDGPELAQLLALLPAGELRRRLERAGSMEPRGEAE